MGGPYLKIFPLSEYLLHLRLTILINGLITYQVFMWKPGSWVNLRMIASLYMCLFNIGQIHVTAVFHMIFYNIFSAARLGANDIKPCVKEDNSNIMVCFLRI